ncbi:hypothetical protein BD779DRAFT_1475769 [Infundibulicybe gibba]|nr:hypothetical protein BD779DRAFT_1475769 [Infundibulicybe gibba]
MESESSSSPTDSTLNDVPPPPESSPNEPKRDPNLWFDDGNLILQAGNTLFRVYGGMLAARSAVFKDMLSFPQPDDVVKLEGCPLVHLHDAPTDVSSFLRAIFDSGFYESPSTPTELSVVTSVLRLSRKYDVPYLRRRSILHFATAYPTTLEDWIKRERARTIPPKDYTPFAVLPVIREFDLPWILPSVMYCLCTHALANTLDGAPWEGSNIDMTWEDKRACIAGRAQLILAQTRAAVEFSKLGEVTDAHDGFNCASIRSHCMDIIVTWDFAGFLEFFEDQLGMIESGMCLVCFTAFKNYYSTTRQTIWDELPETFGLPSWSELEALRDAALE